MRKMSSLLREDISEILSYNSIPWNELQNSTVLVTGATGLIGSALIHTLAAARVEFGIALNIIAHGRNMDKGEALSKECEVEFISSEIREPAFVEHILGFIEKLDYVIHCTAITRSADIVSKPVDVVSTSVDGTRNILELARRLHCKSLVYLSSMEIYGQINSAEVSEGDLGYLDLSNPRSSYPESKRLCEAMCVAYATQYDLPVKIARLAQTFGAGTSFDDSRVFAQFARSVVAGRNIVLHTEGKSKGNYCYTADTIRGLLTILLKGKSGEAYNIANPDASMSIREMAELVAGASHNNIVDVVTIPPKNIRELGYAPETSYVLRADKLKALGWIPKYGLLEMYQRMIADWMDKKDADVNHR